MINIIICAGGTGGHIIPALTVADRLSALGYNIYWLGSCGGLEKTLVSPRFPLYVVEAKRWHGANVLHKIVNMCHIVRAIYKSVLFLRRLRPRLVIGMGGFVSVPGGIAAKLCGVPLLIHEQNSVAGIGNRLLQFFARRICIAYKGVFTGKKVFYTGNPIRPEIQMIKKHKDLKKIGDKLNILILGGSGGALVLNKIVPQAFELLGADVFNVWHQSGAQHVGLVQNLYKHIKCEAKVSAYIENMGDAYKWADLVVCRAGALTCAELQAVGLASILVPYPYAPYNHQALNALQLVHKNAAIMIEEKEFTPEVLAHNLTMLAQSKNTIAYMSECAGAREVEQEEDAAEKIVLQCVACI